VKTKRLVHLRRTKRKKSIIVLFVVEKLIKEEKYYCSVCRREINKEEYEAFDGMCWECWDDRFTEESETMFEDVM